MSVKDLVNQWEKYALGTKTHETYQINLNIEDAAKIHALADMYSKRSTDQIISELISAALSELKTSFPYIEGNQVVSFDEEGDPIFEDIGPTPAFIALTKKHLDRLKQSQTN